MNSRYFIERALWMIPPIMLGIPAVYKEEGLLFLCIMVSNVFGFIEGRTRSNARKDFL